MFWIQLLVLPQVSIAVQVREMIISCGQAPGIILSMNVISGKVSQRSVAVAKPVLSGNVLAVHSMVKSVGQVIKGGVVS